MACRARPSNSLMSMLEIFYRKRFETTANRNNFMLTFSLLSALATTSTKPRLKAPLCADPKYDGWPGTAKELPVGRFEGEWVGRADGAGDIGDSIENGPPRYASMRE